MAKLVYDDNGRLLFTEEMRQEGYKILVPQMLPMHFTMLIRMMNRKGFNMEILNTNHRSIVDEGLKYVHNDTCYPALLVIGQFLDALKSGDYDQNKVALAITQTGGGCRASNYIHLLRKALDKSGYGHVPVISLNLSGLENNPGFKLGLNDLIRMIFCVLYGDVMMNAANQCRPHEINAGETDSVIEDCMTMMLDAFEQGKGLSKKSLPGHFTKILDRFAAIPIEKTDKPRIGIVGEIYVKYSPLGNNELEKFLLSEGAEPVIPGLLDFAIFKVHNREVDVDLYGGKWVKKFACGIGHRWMEGCQNLMIETMNKHGRFHAPCNFSRLHKLVQGYLGDGNKMGEGWLLTAEMLELIHDGVGGIVCAQPFGCLPNHIVGKGMVRRIKDDYPHSNIVAIDYDPGATKINQENRIKLMLANARRHQKQTTSPTAEGVKS